MTEDGEPDSDFVLLREQVEKLGRDKFIDFVITIGDPASLAGLIQVLGLSSPEAIDVVASFVVLRGTGASPHELERWKLRATAVLAGALSKSKLN
jgi:hypothetical protein